MEFLISKEDWKKSGIYKITRKNDPFQIYIGSAKNFVFRFYNHHSDLRRNEHVNPILQNIFNKIAIKAGLAKVPLEKQLARYKKHSERVKIWWSLNREYILSRQATNRRGKAKNN